MKRNSITSRLSLRAKFKDSHTVEVCIMNEYGEILIFMLPIDFENDQLKVDKIKKVVQNKSIRSEEDQIDVEEDKLDD